MVKVYRFNTNICSSPVLRLKELVFAEGHAGLVLNVAAQQPPLRVLRSTALWGVLGFILVVVGLVVFDDVILTAEQSDHTWEMTNMAGFWLTFEAERQIIWPLDGMRWTPSPHRTRSLCTIQLLYSVIINCYSGYSATVPLEVCSTKQLQWKSWILAWMINFIC